MANNSAIEWTEASWNCTTGCTEVSDECKECYARKLHKRLTAMGLRKYKLPFHTVVCHEDTLEIPFHWKKPRKIFVDSMSDLFHPDIPFSFVMKVFETMVKADWHIYQVLTKRPERMEQFVSEWLDKKKLGFVPEHIWLGVSCGRQQWTSRIDILKMIPAKIRFVSFEPLLEKVTTDLRYIQWAIAGGESGTNFRPVKKEWIVEIKRICERDGVKFFFKQYGGKTPKSGGRELDGKTYSEYPLIKIRSFGKR